MILIVGEADVSKVKQMLHSNGEPDVYEIGEIVERAAAAASGEHSVVVENTVGQW
jgi:BioD-like phosphotransacetylase family protein